MAVYTRQGVIKCLKAFKTFSKGSKKKGKVYIKKVRTSTKLETEDEQFHTILYKQMNLTDKIVQAIVRFPFHVKTGMKIAVNGAYIHGESFTQLSVKLDPRLAISTRGWLHTGVLWSLKKFSFTAGEKTKMKKYANIISNPHNFTLAIVLTPSSTKIYANDVFVFSTKAICWIEEVEIRRYSQVYWLVIQKAAEDEMKDTVAPSRKDRKQRVFNAILRL